MTEIRRSDHPQLVDFVLGSYYSLLRIDLRPRIEPVARWIVDQLRNVELDKCGFPQGSSEFKDELVAKLAEAVNPNSTELERFFEEMTPQDLHVEMLLNVNAYFVASDLQQLEQSLPMNTFETGCPDETLLINAFHLAAGLRGRIRFLLNHWEVTGTPLSPRVAALDTVRQWYERLFARSWNVLRALVEFRSAASAPWLSVQLEQWTNLLTVLLNDGFLVGAQPSQVMRTKVTHQVTLNHLGGECLRKELEACRLSVCLLTESQAQQVSEGGFVPQDHNSGLLKHDIVSFAYNPQTKMMSVEIKNLKILKIFRPDRPDKERVTDEKYGLLFYFTFKLGEISFTPRVLSLPVVVIVHPNQETKAWATIAWDTAGFEINRLPFCVPPTQLPWSQVANMLNRKFETTTGRSLSSENLHYLREKAISPENQTISLSQFCQDNLPGRKFTFWEWFHAAMKVTRDHLKQAWVTGYVIGFIGKARAEEYLRGYPAGSFLLRFPDSLLGSITIAYLTADSEVRHVQPYTSREMENRPLADSIDALDDLRFVYPGVPKAEVFVRSEVPEVCNHQRRTVLREPRAERFCRVIRILRNRNNICLIINEGLER